MRSALVVLGLLVFVAVAYWCVLSAHVVDRQLNEFRANPYRADEAGRAALERLSGEWESVSWSLADGTRQQAWYAPSRNGAAVAFAHGSPGRGLGMRNEGADALRAYGFGILLIDLPGYGASEGERTWDARFVESFREGIRFLSARPDVKPGAIGAFGYSNGGWVVAEAAARDERIGAVLLLASYTRYADHLRAAFARRVPLQPCVAILTARLRGVPVDDLDTLGALERMATRPTLIAWGEDDHAIPGWMGPRLVEVVEGAVGRPRPGVAHAGFFGEAESPWAGEVAAFFAQLTPQTLR